MKLDQLLLLFAIGVFFASTGKAQTTKNVSQTGYVNFNLGKSPVSPSSPQEMSLYGCNTHIQIKTTDSVLVEVGGDSTWYNKSSLVWGKDNQVLSGIPYGSQGSGSGSYYVSKYYMASPPVMQTKVSKKNKKDTIANIGLVIPDRFTFFGETPVQIVHLNYTILEPVYLNYVGINYDYVHKKQKTCSELGVDLVPLNIQCSDFKWQDKNGITGAEGASGIARIWNVDQQRQVFLPSYASDSTDFLDCELTIMDDIIKDYEVFFAVSKDSISKSISLTKVHSEAEEIKLYCRKRTNGLPPGCSAPKAPMKYVFPE